MESICDTPHFVQVAVVALQLPSKVAGVGMFPYPCGHPDARGLRHTGLSRFKSLIACKPQDEETIEKTVYSDLFPCCLIYVIYSKIGRGERHKGTVRHFFGGFFSREERKGYRFVCTTVVISVEGWCGSHTSYRVFFLNIV